MNDLYCLPDRFVKHTYFEPNTGHWLWTASLIRGYGQFRVNHRPAYAHRYAYEHLVGPVPEGLELDHLCRVRRCVNPDHLQPVTHRQNVLRGDSPTADNAVKTHCPTGHPYDEANTYRRDDGHRKCRACNRRMSAAAYARRRQFLEPRQESTNE